MYKSIKCNLIAGGDQVFLPTPSDIQFGKERICKEQRAMDGTMIIDMIAVKDSFELIWDIMDSSNLDEIKELLENKGHTFFQINIKMELNDVIAGKGSTVLSESKLANMAKTVYLSDFTYAPYFIEGGFVWKDVHIKLVEK
ncbi:MAG: hypothetical protein K2K85_01220 [Clostridia bacterium]|nr:hypothetical protein [Clostridia bacterium]